MDRPLPGKEGYLWKEGHKRKNWKRRWFVLSEGSLHLYESPETLSPITTLVVTGSEIVSCRNARSGRFAFRFNTVEREADGFLKYIISGESEEESLTWVKALMAEGAACDLMGLSVQPKPLLQKMGSSIGSLVGK